MNRDSRCIICLSSLWYVFLVYFFRYIFSFFFFYYSFNLPQHIHHHHHYHPQQQELMSRAQVRFFLPLFYFSNYYFTCKVSPHHLRIQRRPKKGSRHVAHVLSPGKFFSFFFYLTTNILLIDLRHTI